MTHVPGRAASAAAAFSPEIDVVVRPPPQLGVEGMELSSAGHEDDPDLALERHRLWAPGLFSLGIAVCRLGVFVFLSAVLTAGSRRGGAEQMEKRVADAERVDRGCWARTAGAESGVVAAAAAASAGWRCGCWLHESASSGPNSTPHLLAR